jgi:hypothetical protein
MTRNEILRRWPNASEATIRRNLSPDCAVPDTQQREWPEGLARCDAGETQSASCLRVRFTLHRVKPLDVDAKYASVKDLLDCLANAGIVAGDKEGQISLEVEQKKVRSFKEERTVIEVFPDQSLSSSP